MPCQAWGLSSCIINRYKMPQTCGSAPHNCLCCVRIQRQPKSENVRYANWETIYIKNIGPNGPKEGFTFPRIFTQNFKKRERQSLFLPPGGFCENFTERAEKGKGIGKVSTLHSGSAEQTPL